MQQVATDTGKMFLSVQSFIFLINSSLIAMLSYLKFHNRKGKIKCNIVF